MYVPPGYEWSAPQIVLGAFSNVIGMNESSAPERNSPIHVFYALPDLLREIKYAATVDVDIYVPIDYEHLLGQVKASKFSWRELAPITTSMGTVPIHERTIDGVETYSNGDAKQFKVIIRQYALCWKSACVIVSTVTPEPLDNRLRGNIEQAISSIRLIPKTAGELVLPPEGPKAAQYSLKGAAHPGQTFAQPRPDPLEEVNRINEFNRQNRERNSNQPPQDAPPTNQGGASDQNGAPPSTPPQGQTGNGASNSGG